MVVHVSFGPNSETKAALEKAKNGKLQGPLDVSSVKAMYESMDYDLLTKRKAC